jgi:hypothetical protein
VWLSVPSEAFWTNEGVCQVGEQEQRNAATENIVDDHFFSLALERVTSFYVGETKGKEQNSDSDNGHIHCVYSFCSFVLCEFDRRVRNISKVSRRIFGDGTGCIF